MTRALSLLCLLLAVAASAAAQDRPLRMVHIVDADGPALNRHLDAHFAEHLGDDIYEGSGSGETLRITLSPQSVLSPRVDRAN